MRPCTEEIFLDDVKNHTYEVLLDNGVYRHLKFTNGGSNIYRFDLITYPGGLVFRGDMGTFVFERVNDMFNFFRDETINPGYWSEKLEAVDRTSDFREWDEDEAEKAIWDRFDEFVENNNLPDEIKTELREDIKDRLISNVENDALLYDALSSYSFQESDGEGNEYSFTIDAYDFMEYGYYSYTYHFIWALYAIVWGIRKYEFERTMETK